MDDADDDLLSTYAEPYRVKVVEEVRLLDRAARTRVLEKAFYSVAYIDADDCYVDLATDSGTGAMSDAQWAGMMRGDESYIRSRNYLNFERAVQDVTKYPFVVPTHQGRAAESILAELLIEPGSIVPSNTLFDTTRAHVENRKALPLDLIGDWLWDFGEERPFKGNFDLAKLEACLERYRAKIPFVLVTVTNNLACSSPVSMENIRGVKALADRHGIPILFDACRFAENAYFIKTREPGYADKSIQEIAHEMFSYGQGCWMSAKKDALVNIGGFIALRDEALARRCQERLVLYEGFPTYGGLAGRDMEAVAIGLHEGMREPYLRHRVGQSAYLAELLSDAGIVVSKPAGGSGVFLDVTSFYPHLPPEKLPAIALACDMYLEGGVRVGALPFPLNTIDPATGEVFPKPFQFARFAIPRRLYTRSHLEYVARVTKRAKQRAAESKGYRIVHWPEVLGHFFAKFEPIR